MEHVGIVVEDLPAAVGFFAALGMEEQGQGSADGEWVDRVIGLKGADVEFAMMKTSDGAGQIELVRFNSPVHEGGVAEHPANVPGMRHLAFVVEDIEATIADLRAHGADVIGGPENYSDIFLLAYVRGPAGMIVELAEKIG